MTLSGAMGMTRVHQSTSQVSVLRDLLRGVVEKSGGGAQGFIFYQYSLILLEHLFLEWLRVGRCNQTMLHWFSVAVSSQKLGNL